MSRDLAKRRMLTFYGVLFCEVRSLKLLMAITLTDLHMFVVVLMTITLFQCLELKNKEKKKNTKRHFSAFIVSRQRISCMLAYHYIFALLFMRLFTGYVLD